MRLQATVRTAGPDGGVLLRDDGHDLRYEAAALDRAVRLLRSGQRVVVRVEDDVVVALTLAGLPLS